MSKNRPKPPAEPSGKSQPMRPRLTGGAPHLAIRMLVSMLVLWHLAAVFLAPLSLPPTSPTIGTLVQGTPERTSPLGWYLDALYLNHGYHFFAPSPGPGHIVRYRVTDDRGQVVTEGEFPDAKEYWPRLRYHRHFMLADQAELPLANPDPAVSERLTLEAYARHLLRQHGGQQAQVTRVRHYMLSPREKRDETPADAPHKYETAGQAVQRASDLAQDGQRAAMRGNNLGTSISRGPWQGVR